MNVERQTWRVLYIEDQPEMVELVRLALRSLRCEVLGAYSAEQGLQLMRESRPDVVLLDLMLSGSDGWRVREAMQSDPQLSRLPVILVTAHVPQMGGSSTRALPRADGYVLKPFSLAQMRSTVQSVLMQHAAVDAQPA